MCGIVGIASKLPFAKDYSLTTATDVLRHRGPDDTGEWWSTDRGVGLGHTRLAVLDLSASGHQPMHLPELGLSIVFNGELYNFKALREELERCGYRFQSSSDTEVLLVAYDAWGVDCLARFNGMFAFAIFDARRKRLFLARDRAGEKPIFYRLAQDTLHFASELKALMIQPLRVDHTALDCYLTMGFVPGDLCILQGYNKLPPAHALCFDLNRGTAEIWRYWQIPEWQPQGVAGIPDESSLLDDLEILLEDTVAQQMIADVPVGVLLSGGVDSSLITAMAVRHSGKVRTFTIGFPGQGSMDETEHARLIARHFGTEHIELMAEPTAAELIPKLASQFDEPILDSSMIPTYMVSKLVRQHCTVALGGDGGDELFGGYNHYSRLLWMQRWLGGIPYGLRKLISESAGRVLPVGFKGRNWLQGLGIDLRQGLPLIASYFETAVRKQLMARIPGYVLRAEEIYRNRIPHQADLLSRATRMDFSDYLAEDILVKVDRASMLNSLEVRAPLLDYRLVEFAFGRVPPQLKTTDREKKILLKRLAKRVLPQQFDCQRKQGFSIPLANWLKEGPFRDLFHDVLNHPHCAFDKSVVHRLLKGFDRGHNNGERLFGLVLFELWRREYGVSL